MAQHYKSKNHFTKADWRLYYATYNRLSTERCQRGEVGDHIGNDHAAREFVAQVNPGPRK